MVNITISFDPDNRSDVTRARDLLDRLSTAEPAGTPDPETVHQKVIALLRGYGHNRTEYIRAVAQASPGRAKYEDLIRIVGSPKAIGGTHSAIERAWRAKGMKTPFICTNTNGDSSMEPGLADIVLGVLHDWVDEPDPLPSARF